jgi:hypothetical protein
MSECAKRRFVVRRAKQDVLTRRDRAVVVRRREHGDLDADVSSGLAHHARELASSHDADAW